MGRKPQLDEDESSLRAGRDEMNLLEHSVFGADKKPDMDTRSLLFATWDKHPETGEPIERSWKVTFASEYGRPTPKDDDVYVALLKVTQQAGLMEQREGEIDLSASKVPFSSYQLIRSLRWPENGASYEAIDAAFNRIGGVYILAKNYWWDNVEKEYADRKFKLIDDVFLYERDKYDRALKKARLEGRDRPLSWFRWSEVMLESFQSGYVRKLDMGIYNSLEHPIARKLYRYLGKQFWYRSKHAIDLQELCHEKLGYHQNEKRNPRLRQKIDPAIQELKEKGIFGLDHQFNSSYGKCEVIFTAKNKTSEKPKKAEAPESPLVSQLVTLGVSRADALSATNRLQAARIIGDIEHVEYEAKAGRIKTSKAGLLASMLKSDEPWPRPQGFVSSADRKAAADKAAMLQAERAKTAKALEERKREAEEREEAAFIEFMAGFSNDERLAFEQAALEDHKFCRDQYEKAKASGDSDRMALYLKTALHTAWKKSSAAQSGNSIGGKRTSQSVLQF